MQTNDHKIRNYSEVLDRKYGQEGSPERIKFEEEAYAFYSGTIIHDARKKATLTQAELGQSIHITHRERYNHTKRCNILQIGKRNGP